MKTYRIQVLGCDTDDGLFTRGGDLAGTQNEVQVKHDRDLAAAIVRSEGYVGPTLTHTVEPREGLYLVTVTIYDPERGSTRGETVVFAAQLAQVVSAMTATPKTHLFRSTGAAYDACQCDEAVATGDVLVIDSEQVIGVAHTWPFAVTAQAGQLHQLKPGYAAADVDPRCGLGAAEALRLAAERGWEVRRG